MKHLSLLCRTLRQQLAADVSLTRAARTLARGGPRTTRRLGVHLSAALEQGRSLSDSLDDFRPPLPELFRAMVRVGEETGRLPETLAGLESHYALEERMRRQIRGRIAVVLAQWTLACLVLALAISITSALAPSGGFALFGLRGWSGALIFLGLAAGVLACVFALAKLIGAGVRHSRALAGIARRLPGIGDYLEARLLSRLALALQQTLDSSLSVSRALELSFRAMGAAGHARAGEKASAALRRGRDLSSALAETELLPMEFLEVVAVAEVAGMVPERMGKLAEQYHEAALLRSRSLVRCFSLVLWLLYAGVVIWAIFQLAGSHQDLLR